MNKTLKITFTTIISLVIVFLIYIHIDPDLPEGAELAIETGLVRNYSPLLQGEAGTFRSGDVTIWYEDFQNRTAGKTPILLINGVLSTATQWNMDLIKLLVFSGYRVIRYDHRSVGLSDHLPEWTEETAYTMEDLINDPLDVLNHLNLKQVHIIGYSMGGYIGQRIAIDYPKLVKSLTLFSTSADLIDKRHPQFDWFPEPVVRLGLRAYFFDSEENRLKTALKFLEYVNNGNQYAMDLNAIVDRSLLTMRSRPVNLNAFDQHRHAIRASRSTFDHLSKINVPVFVAHGSNDPIQSFDLAKEMADQFQDIDTVWIEGAGHLISDNYINRVRKPLISMLNRADTLNTVSILASEQ